MKKLDNLINEALLLYGKNKDLNVFEFNRLINVIDKMNDELWNQFSKTIRTKFKQPMSITNAYIDKAKFSLKIETKSGNLISTNSYVDIFPKNFSIKEFLYALESFIKENEQY